MIEIPPIQASTLLLYLSMITSNYHSETNPNEYINAKVDCFSKHSQFMPDDNKFVLFMMFTSYNWTQPTQWWSQNVDLCLSSSIQSAVYILSYYQLLFIWSLCRCRLSLCYFWNYADHKKYTVDCSCRPILLNELSPYVHISHQKTLADGDYELPWEWQSKLVVHSAGHSAMLGGSLHLCWLFFKD